MNSIVNIVYFVILRILWIFRSLYETLMPEKNVANAGGINSKNIETPISFKCENEKRHLIHLFTTTPKQENGRRVCYMDVCEIISPLEEEMLRCACAKGGPNTTYFKYNNNNSENHFPPTTTMSRQAFTHAWMETFSLVA